MFDIFTGQIVLNERIQSRRQDYDRKKYKKMSYVFHKRSEKLTEEDPKYLMRYLGFSEESS